ncbi:hypothetical protein CRYUN_Cryun22dG0019200 [Craigia yunnanensis]
MGQYALSVSKAVAADGLLFGPESDDELVTVTRFPWIKVTRNEFEPVFSKPYPDSTPMMELFMDQVIATSNSYGKLVNSFYEMDKYFIDCWSREEKLKVWCVGPLCHAEPPKVEHEHESQKKPSWIKWLDEKLDQGCSVLKKESELDEGFEERVKERGVVVREWVDQREILMHQSVQGFLSHCGWNSVLESICAGVPILACPMLAEQPLNARMVVEEIKAGLRVKTCDGTVRSGFVKWEGLMKMVRELMEGEMGKEVRKKVKELAELDKMATEEKRDHLGKH